MLQQLLLVTWYQVSQAVIQIVYSMYYKCIILHTAVVQTLYCCATSQIAGPLVISMFWFRVY